MKTNARLLMRLQGLYFILLGLLPQITSHNFLQSLTVFGPQWLVRLSSGIMLSVGAALLIQSTLRKPNNGVLTLGVLAALVLFAMDLMIEFATPSQMTINIGDAIAQAVFVGLGSTALIRSDSFSRR